MKSSDKLRNMPIGKLIVVMSVPAMFSMLIQSLYNIVDSIYVSQISNTALNAVNFAFPMQILIIAFALGIGIGTSSLISRKMGERKPEEASQIAKTGIFLALLAYLLFIIIGLFLVEPYLRIMTDNEEIITMGTQYLQIVLLFSIFVFVEMTSTKILQGIGNMLIPMIAQIIGAITNIILDPIFIFTFNFGISGAAIATVIGQFFSMAFTLCTFIFKKQEISISLKGFKIHSKNVLGIMNVGLPVTVMNSIASLTTATMNSLLMTYSSTKELGEVVVNVLGVYFKLQSFVFMPIFGLNQGGMPILAYNYGSNNRGRYYKALKLILITALITVSIGLIIFQVFPTQLLSLFNHNQDMTIIGIDAYRKISISFIPAAFGIIFSMSFQAMGHGTKSLVMSLFRQLIILIPFAIMFSILFSVDFIWYSYVIAEITTALIFVPIAIMTVRKQFALKQTKHELTLDL